jgi:hypothetical protein
MKFGNSKFYDIKTDEGLKSINVDNIASVEDIFNHGIKITLNVKDEKGINLSFIAKSINYQSVLSVIKTIVAKQN